MRHNPRSTTPLLTDGKSLMISGSMDILELFPHIKLVFEAPGDTLWSIPVPFPYLVLQGFISSMVLGIARGVALCFFFQFRRNIFQLPYGHVFVAVGG